MARATVWPLAAVLAMMVCAATAQAASTRAEYVAQVDPICRASQHQQKRDFRRYNQRLDRLEDQGVDLDKPTKAVSRIVIRFYDRIATVQRGTNAQIAAVPPAQGDEGSVAEWLGLRAEHTEFVNHAIHAYLRNRKPHQFKRLMGRANLAEINAESAVADFDFRYCTPLLAD